MITSLISRHRFWCVAHAALAVAAASAAQNTPAIEPCRIEVVDKENGWPVPLVELRTTHDVVLVTDNAGVAAVDQPELMDREVYFHVAGHGYAPHADGFGFRGVRLTPRSGQTLRVEVERSIIAKRLGRLTGAGIFGESQKLGDHADWRESGVFGCDSIQLATYGDRLFWSWGDTDLARYPLGIFHMSSATTPLRPLERLEPPIALQYDYFADERGIPRGVAQMPGEGPTWLSGYTVVSDATGRTRFGATYSKIRGMLEAYEVGLCVWNAETDHFEQLRTLWTKSDSAPKAPPFPDGHVTLWHDDAGQPVLLFGNPLPTLRCPATFEAWQDPQQWEVLSPQKELPSAADGEPVAIHSGSIAWNEYRKRWVTVFMQALGKPSAFGELWYAEADTPTGPWGPAVKILSHDNYTFYNPRLHVELADANSKILLFEGTYTATFADRPQPTPRYDYNQILYRLDLDDRALEPAQRAAALRALRVPLAFPPVQSGFRYSHMTNRHGARSPLGRNDICTASSRGAVGWQTAPLSAILRLPNTRCDMLRYAIIFLIVAIIAGVLGLGVVEGTAAWIAKALFVIFIVLFLISLVAGRRPPVV